MTYPFDPDGEMMKDRRYGIGLQEQAELRALQSNRKFLKGFLARLEKNGLVTSPDAKAIVRNVNEILEERN